jgi:hypothetical protein
MRPVPTAQRMLHLLGETAREIGIPMLVFAPLASAFSERPLNLDSLIVVVTASLALIVCGILMETND